MRTIIIAVILIAISNSISGQYIRVTEKVKDNMIELKSTESNIVDINSQLEVEIIKDSLIMKMSKSLGINQDLRSQVEKLNYILENQIEILNKLETNVANLSKEQQIETLGGYSLLMVKFYERLMEAKNNEIRNSANKYLAEYIDLRKVGKINIITYPDHVTYVILKLLSETDKTLKMIGSSEDFQKIKFQLTATLNTGTGYPSKVHIENFDNYSEGEYHQVPRWVTTFSDEDIAEFEKMKISSEQLNKMVNYDIDNLSDLIHANFKSIGCLQKLVFKMESEVQNNITIDEQQKNGVKKLVENLSDEFIEFTNILTANNKDVNILELFNNYKEVVIVAADSLSSRISSLSEENTELVASLPPELSNLFKQINTCRDELSKDIESVKTITEVAANLLSPLKKTGDIADQVSDEVLSFSSDNLPSRGYINLETSGPRKSGNKLIIRMKVIGPEKDGVVPPNETIEKRTLELQLTKVYSISKVTLILAIPYGSKKIELQKMNDVQFAPSGSLLFKYGSRKSRTWNFLNPGIGFNISTPDFNLDGTPDVGLGVIGTVLKDILSIGWSYNTTTNSPYWFVGLSIPITMPGLPINTVQSKSVE